MCACAEYLGLDGPGKRRYRFLISGHHLHGETGTGRLRVLCNRQVMGYGIFSIRCHGKDKDKDTCAAALRHLLIPYLSLAL